MSKCKAVLDGDKIIEIQVKARKPIPPKEKQSPAIPIAQTAGTEKKSGQ